jgi:hypothetical protein
MNTPGHAVLNLALLGGPAPRRLAAPILAGAVLPDAPIVLFYLWEKIARGATEAAIWGELYFRHDWQLCFDVVHSIPLAAGGWLLARARGMQRLAAFWASVLLHAACDLPLHHDDGHRHFLPFSSWRFASPLSYWDPRHHGALTAAGEAAIVMAASVVLWRRYRSGGARTALLLVCFLYVFAYAALYVG